MTGTTATHLVVVVLAGVGSILLALFGKIPGADALVVLATLGGASGATAAISSQVTPPPKPPPPTP